MQNLFVCMILLVLCFFFCVVARFFFLSIAKLVMHLFLLVSLLHFAQRFGLRCAHNYLFVCLHFFFHFEYAIALFSYWFAMAIQF